MTATRTLGTLAARRMWVYGGGLAAIVGVRVASDSRTVRIGVVSVVLGVMVLTYVGEQVADAGEPVDADPSLSLLGVGVVGIAVGSALTLSGTRTGVVFVGGGLLFLRRGLQTGDRS